jgi:hypothetical protein
MTQLPHNPLDLTILLFKNMQPRQLFDGQLSGKVKDSFDFEVLVPALESADLLINANATNRTIECHVGKGFFESLDDVLIAPARRLSVPKPFYLADDDYLYSDSDTGLPAKVKNYVAATKLYALFAKEADHQGGIGDNKTLVFLHKEKIEITSEYSADDLHDLTGLTEFEVNFICSETHQEQKRTILKTVLLELFSGQKKVRFSELLARFDEFIEKVQSSYQLYVAEFSFQKVKAEVEKEKLDAMIKLNKVFSDIQGQLLAVPVALVLVCGQMEDKCELTTKNFSIWLGALIFTIFMDLLIRNQRHTLKAVKNEIDQQRQQLESKYKTIASRFENIYTEIDGRHTHQKRLIWIVEALVAISLAITTVALWWYSGAFPYGR